MSTSPQEPEQRHFIVLSILRVSHDAPITKQARNSLSPGTQTGVGSSQRCVPLSPSMVTGGGGGQRYVHLSTSTQNGCVSSQRCMLLSPSMPTGGDGQRCMPLSPRLLTGGGGGLRLMPLSTSMPTGCGRQRSRYLQACQAAPKPEANGEGSVVLGGIHS